MTVFKMSNESSINRQYVSRQAYAIVIDMNSINGLQTARILARREVPVIGIAKDLKHHICSTNVCDDIIQADTSSEDFIEALKLLGPRLPQKAVLFPCTDMNVLLVSRHRESLSPWYHISLPPSEVVEMMLNKYSFYSYAQEKGLPIAPTWFLRSRRDAEEAAKQINFPCVLKPPISATLAWEKESKLKAYKVSNQKELLQSYDHFRDWADVLIVQEWIEGSDNNLFTCNCYFDAKFDPVITFVSRKIRQWPPLTGEGCMAVECRNDYILQETLKVFSGLNYHGLGYLEMKQDQRTKNYYITEPNIGRPTGRSAIAEAGGVELLYTMYCENIGKPLPKNRQQSYQDAKWIYIRRDVQSLVYNLLRGNLTLRQWLQTLRGKKAYAVFSWTDLGPFWGDWLRLLRIFLSPRERKRRDYENPLS